MLLFSHPVVSVSLWPHRLQHTKPPFPSPSSRVCSSSCPLHQRCHPDISSSDALFSFSPQSFPASGTHPVSRLFTSDDQNTGTSVSASVFPVNIKDWSPLRLTGWISLLSKGLSGVFFITTVPRHQFFGDLPSLWHIYIYIYILFFTFFSLIDHCLILSLGSCATDRLWLPILYTAACIY